MKTLVRATLAAMLVVGLAGCTGDPGPGPARTNGQEVTCAAGSIPVRLTLPEPAQVRLNLVNGSGVAGLAIPVLVELGDRRFQVLSLSDAGPGEAYPEAVVVRYGPQGAGAAWLVALYFRGKVRTELDAGRTDDTLDVILGRAFENVLTPTEVNQAVAAAGTPTAQPGECAGSG